MYTTSRSFSQTLPLQGIVPFLFREFFLSIGNSSLPLQESFPSSSGLPLQGILPFFFGEFVLADNSHTGPACLSLWHVRRQGYCFKSSIHRASEHHCKWIESVLTRLNLECRSNQPVKSTSFLVARVEIAVWSNPVELRICPIYWHNRAWPLLLWVSTKGPVVGYPRSLRSSSASTLAACRGQSAVHAPLVPS